MTFVFSKPTDEDTSEKFLDTFAELSPSARRAFLNKIAPLRIDPEWAQLHRALSEIHDIVGGELE